MQVKPRFESYKILEQHHVLKDDKGEELCLTLFEAKLPDNEHDMIVTPYRFWTVVCKNSYQWANKAVSYEDCAYYRKEPKLFSGIINGIEVEEYLCGTHRVLDDDKSGPKTSFKIRKELPKRGMI